MSPSYPGIDLSSASVCSARGSPMWSRIAKGPHDQKSRAAEALGISRPRLHRRIKELDLPDDEPAEQNRPSTG